MKECILCPRRCHALRTEGKVGYCGMTTDIYIARAALHYWEEPCISGEEGSGTVFFTGCTLQCVFCQNYRIAEKRIGKKVTIQQLSEIFLNLMRQGANNINLVTPTHYVPQIADALRKAKQMGLQIPVVYNTSGYECVETLKLLEGLIDIYLPDFKYMDGLLAEKYSHANDYFEIAARALEEMVRQIPKAEFSENGLMKKGVIVRHLVLPGSKTDSKKILKYLYHTYRNQIWISLMNQYTPVRTLSEIPVLNRRVTKREYETVVNYMLECGIENGYIQEGGTQKESFIPDFNFEGIE